MQPVVGQSGTIYRSDTLEEMTHVDYLELWREKAKKLFGDFVRKIIAIGDGIRHHLCRIFFDEVVQDKTDRKKEEMMHQRRMRSVDVDMRVKSQVIENKPRHQVRKII